MTIYFDENKNAYGFEIPNPIATIDDVTWQQYATTDKWDIVDGVFVDITDTDEYKEKQALIEKERIARLSCTKRDFALMLQEMGVDYFTQLKPLIDSNPQAQLEWELCERLYRFNPMIDLMAGQLGVTPEMLDGLFQYANGEISAGEFEALLPKEETDQLEDNLDMVEQPTEETENEIS